MSIASLNGLLVIANPAAQSGAGERAAKAVEEELARLASADGGAGGAFCVARTTGPGHAVELARDAAGRGWGTVAALGGDGVVHEVANGLMDVDAAVRPALGVIPIGSGNDYARTLGLARNKPLDALRQLLGGHIVPRDVGRANGAYFVETLSFGLDAAIALHTMDTRKGTGTHGTLLYAASGVDVFVRHRRTYAYEARLAGEEGAQERIRGEGLVFAVQVGPTYGGGFRICPDADPADGLLDICRSTAAPSLARTLAVFFGARVGLHRRSGMVAFHRARGLQIDFSDEPPCQVDGEPLTGTRFDVACLPGALRVVVPA